MTKIEINNIIYHVHPIYNLYGANEAGNIIHIIKKTPIVSKHKPRKKDSVCMVRAYGQSCYKTILTSNFIWECFNGIIPNDKVIDYKNDNKEDNRLCNLNLVTQQENCKKSAKKRDYTFVKYNHENKRCIKAINQNTKEISYYKSMYSAQKSLGINAGIIKMTCEGLNNCKSGISKLNGNQYKFEYIKADD